MVVLPLEMSFDLHNAEIRKFESDHRLSSYVGLNDFGPLAQLVRAIGS